MSQELSDKEIKSAFDKLKITPETESYIKENSDTSIPNSNRKPLLQNVRQTPKPSSQQKTLTFEKFETLLTRHLEKGLTAIQEKFESFFEKISKAIANIECCQNQNTKTLQQNIANLKNELLSKNEIIAAPKNKQTDLLEKSKSHATIQKSPYKDKHQHNQIYDKKIYREVKSSKIKHKIIHKWNVNACIYREFEQKFK